MFIYIERDSGHYFADILINGVAWQGLIGGGATSTSISRCSVSHDAKFDYSDALNLESQLTDEEKLIRDQFKSYCTDQLMPRILMANRNEG